MTIQNNINCEIMALFLSQNPKAPELLRQLCVLILIWPIAFYFHHSGILLYNMFQSHTVVIWKLDPFYGHRKSRPRHEDYHLQFPESKKRNNKIVLSIKSNSWHVH